MVAAPPPQAFARAAAPQAAAAVAQPRVYEPFDSVIVPARDMMGCLKRCGCGAPLWWVKTSACWECHSCGSSTSFFGVGYNPGGGSGVGVHQHQHC